MANKVRGERVLKGAEDYTVVFNSNAIAQAEGELSRAYGRPYGIGAVVQNYMQGMFSINETRILLWAALLKHHGPLSVTDAGEILDEVLEKGKDLGNVFTVIMESLDEAMPFKVEDDSPNDRPVALETGKRATKEPAKKSSGGRSSKQPVEAV